jgi:uncharacterized phage protein gp47/JayE
MADTNTILNRLLTSLSISDPTWDISVGSATYKIMESVASEISNATNNSTLLTYGLDVTTYFGTELDAFVNIFGITRQLGTRSIGTAVFSTPSPAMQNYDIPLGTQVSANVSQYFNNVAFTTTSPATIASGQTSINVPVVSTLPGSFNNVPAQTIAQITTPLVGVTNVTNTYPLTNGTDTETDSQLQQRFLNTAFSNFAGTIPKFQSIAYQNPSITQTNVVNAQQSYIENLQIGTVVSGTASFNIGLQTQAQLLAVSGSTVASSYLGSLQPNVPIGITSTTPSGLLASNTTVTFDGFNYNLSSTASGNGTLNIAYVVSGSSPVTLSGLSTFANIASTISGLLNGTLAYNNQILVTVTGANAVVSGGATITFNQNIPWNVIITSGSNVTASNTIISQVPDSQFSYPAGYELVGTNLATSNQAIFTRNVDYNYYQGLGGTYSPKVTFIPTANNAPSTYTGSIVQFQSTYVPVSSRTIVSGNQIINSNFVDIFINSTNTQTVTEQIVMITSNTISASGTGGLYQANNFILANNVMPPSGDYYLNFSQNPVANFPNQIISGNASSFVTFANNSFPISLTLISSNASTVNVSGAAGTSTLYTTSSISGLQLGLVISGTTNAAISGIGTGNYITSLTTGNPNQIGLANNLTSTITGNNTTWLTVAYPLYDNTKTAGSILDISGIGFRATDPTGSYGASYPGNNNYQVGTFSHAYYSDVVNVDNLAQQSRVVGSNTLAHIANFVNLIINLSVAYTQNTNPIVANTSIQSAISNYLNSINFDSVVSISSLLNAASNVVGVQSIRIATQTDNPNNYGVQVVNLDGSNRGTPYFKDILLANNQVPSLYKINYTVFGANNF